MEMETANIMALVSLLIGLAARVFVPWLAARRLDPENAGWDWKFVWPQLLGFGIIVLLLPLLISDLSVVLEMPAQAAWLVGWGAADIGRKTYKALAGESA